MKKFILDNLTAVSSSFFPWANRENWSQTPRGFETAGRGLQVTGLFMQDEVMVFTLHDQKRSVYG